MLVRYRDDDVGSGHYRHLARYRNRDIEGWGLRSSWRVTDSGVEGGIIDHVARHGNGDITTHRRACCAILLASERCCCCSGLPHRSSVLSHRSRAYRQKRRWAAETKLPAFRQSKFHVTNVSPNLKPSELSCSEPLIHSQSIIFYPSSQKKLELKDQMSVSNL